MAESVFIPKGAGSGDQGLLIGWCRVGPTGVIAEQSPGDLVTNVAADSFGGYTYTLKGGTVCKAAHASVVAPGSVANPMFFAQARVDGDTDVFVRTSSATGGLLNQSHTVWFYSA